MNDKSLVNYSISFKQAYTNWMPMYLANELAEIETKALLDRLMLPKK